MDRGNRRRNTHELLSDQAWCKELVNSKELVVTPCLVVMLSLIDGMGAGLFIALLCHSENWPLRLALTCQPSLTHAQITYSLSLPTVLNSAESRSQFMHTN